MPDEKPPSEITDGACVEQCRVGGDVSSSAQQDSDEASISEGVGAAEVVKAAPGAGRPSDPSLAGTPPNGVPTFRDEGQGLTITSQSDALHAHALTEALDLLRESVQDLVTKKRRTTAAAVSLQMRRRSGNTFTPAVAGFVSFREFLRFAERVGVITILPPVPGGDMEVLSAAAVGAASEPATVVAPPRRIRRDLWQAFVDWAPQWQRVFDVKTGRVVSLPSDASRDNAEASEIRRDWQHDEARYRRIIPLSREDQYGWMRKFVDHLPSGPERDQVGAALDGDRPLSAFVEAIRQYPDIQRSWRYSLTEEVTAAIARWMLQEQLTVDLYHMPAQQEVVRRVDNIGNDAASPSQRLLTESSDPDPLNTLRRQILEAVARMPLSELLRLPIPVEYLLRR